MYEAVSAVNFSHAPYNADVRELSFEEIDEVNGAISFAQARWGFGLANPVIFPAFAGEALGSFLGSFFGGGGGGDNTINSDGDNNINIIVNVEIRK